MRVGRLWVRVHIPKPAFNAVALLYRLGHRRLTMETDSTLVTRREDGTLVLALWHYGPPDGTGDQDVPLTTAMCLGILVESKGRVGIWP